MNDEILWAKIQQHQGETFYTVRKKELVYEVVGDMLYHNLRSVYKELHADRETGC